MAKISKTKIIEDIKNLDTISSYDKKITNDKTKECIITIKGNEKDMAYKNTFEKTVLKFIKEQREFNNEVKNDIKDIKSRLVVLESLPTIQKELSTLPKNKK